MTKELLYSKPQICLFDISEEISNKLKELHFKCYNGSLGPKIEMDAYKQYESKYCILNRFHPLNLHEFDIFIFDLKSFSISPHNKDEYTSLKTHDSYTNAFRLNHPTTIFDQRPYTSSFIGDTINHITDHPIIVIVFASKFYEVNYEFGNISNTQFNYVGNHSGNIYKLLPWLRYHEPLTGEKMVVEKSTPFTKLFDKYINNASYDQSFYVNNGDHSLINNIKGESVSLYKEFRNKIFLILPQFENKIDILTSLLTDIFPRKSSDIFPESTTFSWIKDRSYFLPNHENLLKEKSRIEYVFHNKLIECDKKVENNLNKYDFLYDLIKETDDKLVKSVITFLKWLGFANVKDMDSEKHENSFREEDIQIEFEKGLLVIEVKGITGHPTDSNYSQISKVKLRRIDERKKFDVFALFVVNHQRFLPPLKRTNLQKENIKIQDAINDKRGIVSTWQLFNLYFEIENGVITKDEARERLLEFGLINFRPKSISLLCKVDEILKEGFVFIAIVSNQNIKVGDTLYIEKNDRFSKCIIQSIQLDDKNVNEADNGEVGIKIDIPVKKNSSVYYINKGK